MPLTESFRRKFSCRSSSIEAFTAEIFRASMARATYSPWKLPPCRAWPVSGSNTGLSFTEFSSSTTMRRANSSVSSIGPATWGAQRIE